jgi:hypothetical protein
MKMKEAPKRCGDVRKKKRAEKRRDRIRNERMKKPRAG